MQAYWYSDYYTMLSIIDQSMKACIAEPMFHPGKITQLEGSTKSFRNKAKIQRKSSRRLQTVEHVPVG